MGCLSWSILGKVGVVCALLQHSSSMLLEYAIVVITFKLPCMPNVHESSKNFSSEYQAGPGIQRGALQGVYCLDNYQCGHRKVGGKLIHKGRALQCFGQLHEVKAAAAPINSNAEAAEHPFIVAISQSNQQWRICCHIVTCMQDYAQSVAGKITQKRVDLNQYTNIV